jgi:hypothetical protein
MVSCKFPRQIVLIGLLLLLLLGLSGCATVGTMELYRMDLRSTPIPVMLNAGGPAPQGRNMTVSIFESQNSLTIPMGEYGSYTRTDSTGMTIPLNMQVRTSMIPEDNALYIENVRLSYHEMVGFSRSEDQIRMSIDVWFSER